MISISNIFEGKPAAQSSAESRRDWAKQRMAEAKAAAANGRIDQKTLQQKLKYWQRVSAGSTGTTAESQAGIAPSTADLKTTGTFF